jgi:hypothetical protein
MMSGATFFVLIIASLQLCTMFAFSAVKSNQLVRNRMLTMEYIPDGLSKEQWALVKKKVCSMRENKNFALTSSLRIT